MYKTEGIIIKKNKLADWDCLLTVYSRHWGKLLLKAKSVRKNQAKLAGHLDLFICSHLLIAPGRGWDVISGAETIERFNQLHASLPSLAAAYYLSEITDKLISDSERDERIWKLLFRVLTALNQSQPPFKKIVSYFEKSLLGYLGYGSALGRPAREFIQSLTNSPIKSYAWLKEVLSLA